MKKITLAIGGATISALALVAILAAARFTKADPLDAMGCSPQVKGKTVIVLDTSDDVTAQTRIEIEKRVRNTIDHKVQDGDLVSVFTVSQLSKRNLVPVFAYCKPRREGNELKENTRALNRIYLTKFEKPLLEVIHAPIDGSEESPIAQSLIDLSLSDFLRSTGGSTNLLVFSDLIEHTDKFSLYNCTAGSQAVKLFKERRGAAVARPSFHNVELQLHIIPRGDITAVVGRCRDHFWTWFFGDNDGPNARITPFNLPG